MIILGAGGHAKEILELVHCDGLTDNLCFFDDFNPNSRDIFMNKFKILRSKNELENYFLNQDKKYIIGVGGTVLRKQMNDKAESMGGKLISIISKYAYIGSFDVDLENGLNIMHGAWISNSVKIGKGTLLNAYVKIHHDTTIGEYTEIAPSVTILGACNIGSFVSIGASATLLPKINIGNNVVIGSGSIVTKDVPDNVMVYGVPAKIIKQF